MTSLILIDSYAQIFRGYYAVRSLSNKLGEPTNAIFAMMRFLLKLEHDYPGTEGAFVFDNGRPPHRMALAPDYKANRPPCPEDLQVQFPAIRELIPAFGWSLVEAENTEADDLIASLAQHFSDREIRIISSDKDLAQLIDSQGRVEMLIPDQAGRGFAKRGIQEVVERFGVTPDKIVDYLAIIGDSADNIPGIAGVGPKTAAKLLNQFGSIGEILNRTDEISSESLRTKFRESADLLKKNIELVRLVSDPPAGCVWGKNTIRKNPPDVEKILAIAQQKELRSMIREIEKLAEPDLIADISPAAEKKEPAVQKMEQLSLF